MRKPIVTLMTGLAIMAATDNASSEPAQPYTPGLVEFMMHVQSHHAKLWLAGNARNWDLADYQVDELKELLEDITPGDVAWVCALMNQITDQQWDELFRHVGIPGEISGRYMRKIKSKIDEGLTLNHKTSTKRL